MFFLLSCAHNNMDNDIIYYDKNYQNINEVAC